MSGFLSMVAGTHQKPSLEGIGVSPNPEHVWQISDFVGIQTIRVLHVHMRCVNVVLEARVGSHTIEVDSFGITGSGCGRALTGAGGDGLGRSARWPTMPKKNEGRSTSARATPAIKSQALHTHAHDQGEANALLAGSMHCCGVTRSTQSALRSECGRVGSKGCVIAPAE